MSLKLQTKLFNLLTPIKNALLINQNLYGDRDVEWSFVGAHIVPGNGNALDFGPQNAYLGLMAAQAGYQTIAVDLQDIEWPYQHNNLRFIKGDILTLNFPLNSFELIINCSSVEHVGIAGRYNVAKTTPDGDMQTMQKFHTLLKPNGKMLLTLPVGKDAVFPPLHRVYGEKRLPRLLENYTVLKKEFWAKRGTKKWMQVTQDEALKTVPQEDRYNLGCFILSKCPPLV